MDLCLVNGVAADLSADHRALAFGDGLFETLLCRGRVLDRLDAHLSRLNSGAGVLNLRWSQSDTYRLKAQLVELVSSFNTAEIHVLKVMLLRAYKGRGYDYVPNEQQVDVVIQIKSYRRPDWTYSGYKVVSGSSISQNPQLAAIKHLNRLDSVLAKAAARKQSAHEMLMVDQSDRIVEGSMSNVFVKRNGEWSTPPIVNAGVNGIVRQSILDCYSGFSEQPLFTSELENVQSAFLCNSLIGLVNVLTLNGTELAVDPDVKQIEHELGLQC